MGVVCLESPNVVQFYKYTVRRGPSVGRIVATQIQAPNDSPELDANRRHFSEGTNDRCGRPV